MPLEMQVAPPHKQLTLLYAAFTTLEIESKKPKVYKVIIMVKRTLA